MPSENAPHHSAPPSTWVQVHISGASPGGTVLDVACGGGRNMRVALQLGHPVVGVDRDLAGVRDIEQAASVELIEADLETGRPWPLGSRTFAAVIVTNYLWRPILPDIVAAVARDGLLIYETFAQGQERHGRPSNPDFLLAPGELLEAVRGRLMPLAYACATLTNPTRLVQRLVAVGPDHKWLIDPPSAQF